MNLTQTLRSLPRISRFQRNLFAAALIFSCMAHTREAHAEDSDSACESFLELQFPESDKPTQAERNKLKDCDSEALYYGILMPADPVKARKCAYIEFESAEDGGDPFLFDGATILTNIYANGSGVKRNIPLAKKFACIISFAPAEQEGRLKHLSQIEAGKDTAAFDFCQDVTSGAIAGVCSAHQARIEDEKRSGTIEKLRKKLNPLQGKAYVEFEAALNQFTSSRSEGEIDLSGTLRTTMTIQDEESIKDAFVKDVETLITAKATQHSGDDFQKADNKLNLTYKAVLKQKEFPSGISREGIKSTQRSWLKYRDARARFGQSINATWSKENLMTEPTLARIKMLEDLLD